MGIALSIFFLILAFITLGLSSNKAIDYSLDAAKLFGVSKLFVGFVFLAVSSGLPELMVALHTILLGKHSLSAGDIIGSNFADISLSLGIALASFGPVILSNSLNKMRQLTMLIISSLLMLFIFAVGYLDRTIGILLLSAYGGGIFYIWQTRKEVEPGTPEKPVELEQVQVNRPSRGSVLTRLGGYLLLVIFSSKVCVDSALAIALHLGLPLDIMGASIVAVGTSLPEITLNMQALRKGNISLALGNSLGSIFEQGALILGLLAISTPSSIPLYNLRPIAPFMFGAYALLGYQIMGDRELSKLDGLLLASFYFLFLLYTLLRFY